MVYLHTNHLLADSLIELRDMAFKLGLQRKWMQTDPYPHFVLFGADKPHYAKKWGAIIIDHLTAEEKGKKILRELLPKNLYKEGFSLQRLNALNFDTVLRIRRHYIKVAWNPGKRLNKHYSSFKLSQHASALLNFEVKNGELIAAAILEGYKYVASQPNALFYLDIQL